MDKQLFQDNVFKLEAAGSRIVFGIKGEKKTKITLSDLALRLLAGAEIPNGLYLKEITSDDRDITAARVLKVIQEFCDDRVTDEFGVDAPKVLLTLDTDLEDLPANVDGYEIIDEIAKKEGIHYLEDEDDDYSDDYTPEWQKVHDADYTPEWQKVHDAMSPSWKRGKKVAPTIGDLIEAIRPFIEGTPQE